jgi:putative hydrolase of the HAD superfamily
MSPHPTIRAVILDFGGVLYDMRWDVAHTLEAVHRLPRGAIVNTLYRTETWAAIERGRGDADAWRTEAHGRLETGAGRALPRLHDAWRASQALVPASLAAVRALRPVYRTAILSNADLSLRFRLARAGVLPLFDAALVSAEEGMAKPEPAIYRLAAARLELPPEACLFVDDHGPNVAAAREVGMTAHILRLDRGQDLAGLLAEVGLLAAPADGSPRDGRPR